MADLPKEKMRFLRPFSTSVVCHAAKATKGKAAPKKAAKQSFAKKQKSKDTSSGTAASAFAAKVGSSRASAKLTPDATKVDLSPITPTIFTKDHVGTVFETPANVVAQLYSLDVLERQSGYQYFSQIATVLRHPSVELAELLEQDGSSRDRRILLDGAPGSGKSIAMLQAITFALQKKWVVISIPRAEALIDSTYPYVFDDKRGSWRQDTYMAGLLRRIADANKSILQLQNTSKSFSFDRHSVPEKATLHKMLEIGAQDPAVAHDVFDAFLNEMNIEGRPALLITLDNLSVATLPTRYRDPEFRSVHPFDLEIVKTFVALLSGTKLLTNGAVITNTSSRPSVIPRSLNIALKSEEKSPYETIDERIAGSLTDVRVIKVDEYNQNEARSIIKHYASAGLIRGHTAADISDSLVKQRTLMAGALGRDVLRSCLKQI